MNLKFLIFLTLKIIFINNRQINCPSFKYSSKGMKDKKCFSSIEEYSDGEIKSTIYLSQCKKKKNVRKLHGTQVLEFTLLISSNHSGGKHANRMQIAIVKHVILITIDKIKK